MMCKLLKKFVCFECGQIFTNIWKLADHIVNSDHIDRIWAIKFLKARGGNDYTKALKWKELYE